MREEKKNCTSCVSVGVKLMLFQYRSVFMYENQDTFKICMRACIHYTTVDVCARNKSLLLETTEREINTKKTLPHVFLCCALLKIMYVVFKTIDIFSFRAGKSTNENVLLLGAFDFSAYWKWNTKFSLFLSWLLQGVAWNWK